MELIIATNGGKDGVQGGTLLGFSGLSRGSSSMISLQERGRSCLSVSTWMVEVYPDGIALRIRRRTRKTDVSSYREVTNHETVGFVVDPAAGMQHTHVGQPNRYVLHGCSNVDVPLHELEPALRTGTELLCELELLQLDVMADSNAVPESESVLAAFAQLDVDVRSRL